VGNSWCPDNVPPESTIDSGQIQSLQQISYLCDRGLTPHVLTGFFRDFLAVMWSTADNIVNPVLRKHLWNESAGSGILIENVTRFRADVVEKQPAIMIKRNSIKFVPIGLDDGLIYGNWSDGTNNQVGAFQNHNLLITGSHTLFCIGELGMAEALSHEVLMHVLELCPAFRRDLDLVACLPVELGAVQKLAGTKDRLVAPITVAWQYAHEWQLYEESHPLQRVELNPRFDTDGSLSPAGQPHLI